MCDYGPNPQDVTSKGVVHGPLGVPPEMFKVRPSVVLNSSPGLTIVVPLSTSKPRIPQLYHLMIPAGRYSFLDADTDCWAKCDMIESVSNHRLNRPLVAGVHINAKLTSGDFRDIRKAVRHGLALSRLTDSL